MKEGPRVLKEKIEQFKQPRESYKTAFDFGNAFEDALLHNEYFTVNYGFVATAPDMSGKYATYGRIIAEAMIIATPEQLSSAEWITELKNRALTLSTLAGDIDKADAYLQKEPYKTYFETFLQFKGKITDAQTWSALQTIVNLAWQNTLFKRIMSLPRTEQEVLTWEVAGRKMKGRADVIAVDHEERAIILLSIKTTADNIYNGSFYRTIRNYGYDQQEYGYYSGLCASEEYGALIAKGYSVGCFIAVGYKIPPFGFGLVPISFSTANDDYMNEQVKLFTHYEQTNFAEPEILPTFTREFR